MQIHKTTHTSLLFGIFIFLLFEKLTGQPADQPTYHADNFFFLQIPLCLFFYPVTKVFNKDFFFSNNEYKIQYKTNNNQLSYSLKFFSKVVLVFLHKIHYLCRCMTCDSCNKFQFNFNWTKNLCKKTFLCQ